MKFLWFIFFMCVLQLGYAQPTVTLESVDSTTCFGFSDGSINISVSGGLPPYTFDWDNDGVGDFDDPEDLTGLPAGNYTCVVKDANGYTDIINVTVFEPDDFSYSYLINQNSWCGANNGSFEIEAEGGNGPYIYTIDDFTTTQSTGFFDNLFSGLYQVKIEDANGCLDSTFYALSDYDIAVGVTYTDASCDGLSNGTATVTVGGGYGNTYIDWGYNGWGDNNDPASVTGLAPGTYYVEVWDDGLCFVLEQVTVGFGSSLMEAVIDSTVSNICNYSSNGAIYTSVITGTSPYTFDWDNDGLGDANDPEDLENLPAGTYTLYITDDAGCADTLEYQITEIGYMLSAIVDQANICEGDSLSGIYPTIVAGTPPFLYDWDVDGLGDLDDNLNLLNLPEGDYIFVLQDSNGCMDTLEYTILDGAPFEATITSFMDSLVVDQVGTYQWVECPLHNSISGATNQFYNAIQNGEYAAIVTNTDGCIDTTDCALVQGIGWQEIITEIHIYPNPGNTTVHLSIPSDQGRISLFNMSGKLILQETVQSEHLILEVSELPNGVYNLEYTNFERLVRTKLIIKH
jgi:hypothetical protein